MPVRIKRVYDEAEASDGERILVDRLWPRGITKEKAALDAWMKDVAPSAALRKWFGHKPERWTEFRKRYCDELRANPAVAPLRARIAAGMVTLLYGARDREFNQAVVLADFLEHFQQNRAAVLRPEMRKNKELERLRDSEKSENALSKKG